MTSKMLEDHKQLFKLTRRQRSIIVGTLLGGGRLVTINNGRTYSLTIEHSDKQSVYIDWLYEQFKEGVFTPPRPKGKLLQDAKLENFNFQTFSVGQLRFYGKSFYSIDGKKRVPSQIDHWLTPLALAVWYMDSGSFKSKYHHEVILNTLGVDRKNLILLQKSLTKNFNIETNLRKQKEGIQLLIVRSNAERFIKTVQPHILPNFL